MRLYRFRLLRPLFLLWWRLREREVDDLFASADTFGSPGYNHGKVTGLDPDLHVTTEVSETPYVCCGYCSAAMAVRTARAGLSDLMKNTAHPIRAEGGRPHDNGNKASELRSGSKAAWGVKLEAIARDEIPARLRAGYAVTAALDYADLPSWLKVQGGSFGHAVCLFGWREDGDLVGFFDPLWPQDARGAWAPWSSVKPALWADGEHSTTVVQLEPEPTPPPGPELPPEPPASDPPAITPEELEAAEELAGATAYLERDRAWRGLLGVDQPRVHAGWTGGPADGGHVVRWSWFARWAPMPSEGWNGGAAWDRTRWS